MKTLGTAIVALLVLTAVTGAFAEEKKVTFSFADATLEEAVRFIEALHGVTVEVPEELRSSVLTLEVRELGISAALGLLAKLASPEARVVKLAEDRYRIVLGDEPVDPDAAVSKAVENTRVDVDFRATPLGDVLNFLSTCGGVNMIVLPPVYESLSPEELLVTLRAEEVSLREVLDRVTRKKGLTWRIEKGVVMVDVSPPRDWREVLRERLGSVANLDFADTPLSDALRFLGSFGNVSIVVDPEIFETRGADRLLVSLRADGVTLKNGLDLITLTKGLDYDLRWGAVFVSTPERLAKLPSTERKLLDDANDPDLAKVQQALRAKATFSFDRATVPEVLEYLSTIHRVNIVLDPALQAEAEESEVTMTVTDVPLLDALCLVLLPRDFPFRYQEGVVFVSRSEPSRPKVEERRGFPGVEPMSVSFEETPLPEVLANLAARSGVPIVLDPHVTETRRADDLRVALQTRELELDRLLDFVTVTKRLAWDGRYGVVFVSSAERLAALPTTEEVLGEPSVDAEPWEKDLRLKLREKVSVAFADAALGNTLEFFATVKRMNIVLDPEARPAAFATMVTVQVRDVPLADALALVLLPRGFTFSLANEVVLVRER